MCPPHSRPIPATPNATQVAYVNVQQNHTGRTALHFAAMNEHAGTIRILIDHGADPCIRDEMGRSARDYTRESSDAYEILQRAELDIRARGSLRA